LGKLDAENVINLGKGIAFKRFLNGYSTEEPKADAQEFI
jgi:hypothetical protein